MDTQYLALVQPGKDFLAMPDPGPGGDLELGAGRLPPGWSRSRRGGWVIYTPPAAPSPQTGWKIHVSCRPERASSVVSTTVDICARHGVPVKSLRAQSLVIASLGKYAPATAAGKVLTAYPCDDTALTDVATALAAALHGEPGLRIRNEVPAPDAPVFLRYGAFREVWLETADGGMVPGKQQEGRVRPDPRRHPGASGCGARGPQLVRQWEAAASLRDSGLVLPLTQARILHRSTAGDVYYGRWDDPEGTTPGADVTAGSEVVVKEARHHCGFDASGSDAVTRLRHEWVVLRRLSGLGVAPEPLAYLTLGDSDFLIMSYLAGTTLSAMIAGAHPGIIPGRGSATEYLLNRERLIPLVESALATAHREGVVHGDVHGANVVDLGDRVCLLDWESASLDGVAVSTGVRAVDVPLTAEGDLSAAAHLADTLVAPMAVLALRRPDLRKTIVATGRQELDAGGTLTDLDEARLGPRDAAAALLAGLLLVASTQPADRPFPGDLVQFRAPWASMGLLHGTCGVALAVSKTAAGDRASVGEESLGDWLSAWGERVHAATTRPDLARGLADGLDGVAVASLRLGWTDLAEDVATRLDAAPAPALQPWWGAGSGGRGVALAELAAGLDRGQLTERAVQHLDLAAAAVDGAASLPGYRPGLLAGLSGVALALLRGADLIPERATDYRARAGLAIERELDHTRQVGEGLLTIDSQAVLPYLGNGSAALGLALHALRARVGSLEGPSQEALRRIEATLRVPVVAQAGLLRGRSGLLMALETMQPGDVNIGRHRERLAWHLVPGARTHAFTEHPEVAFCLGEQNLRISTDLGTGSAGALVALTPGVLLHDVLPLPGPPGGVTTKS